MLFFFFIFFFSSRRRHTRCALVTGVQTCALPIYVRAESSTEVDISAIEPGQAIKAVFRRQPLFVKRLTAAEIAAANGVDVAALRDPQTLEIGRASCRERVCQYV